MLHAVSVQIRVQQDCTCRGTGTQRCYEDRASLSKGNYESHHHREKNSNEQPFSKKRQKTTFSPIEVGELERVFKRRPFLTPEDEDALVQRLGITPKNVKVSKRYLIISRDLCHLEPSGAANDKIEPLKKQLSCFSFIIFNSCLCKIFLQVKRVQYFRVC